MAAIPEEDMFGDLPDPIIHQILSFLSTKEAAQKSILSKRWLKLWRTFPIIDLDVNHFVKNHDKINAYEELRWLEYMDRTLQTRGLTYVQELRIRTPYFGDFPKPRVVKYIKMAVRSNVSVFDLSTFNEKYLYVVSSELFALGSSLVHLRLRYCQFDEYNVMNLKSLKSLQLECVTNMTKETILKMISSSPLLESLILIRCTVRGNSTTLEIFHNSLKYLDVQQCGYPMILKLDVPKLLSLTCKVMEGYHMFRGDKQYGGLEIKTLKVDSLRSLSSLRLLDLYMKEEHFHELLSSTQNLKHFGIEQASIEKETPKTFHYAKLKELESLVHKDQFNIYKIKDFAGMGFGKLTKLSLFWYASKFLVNSCPKDDDGILLLSHCFPLLEDLTLSSCQKIEHLMFRSQSLKRLYVERCLNLKDMNIDACNLVFFKYVGFIIQVSNLIKSSLCKADLQVLPKLPTPSSSSFSYYSYDPFYQDPEALKLLRNLVKMFDDTRMLTLTCESCNSDQYVIPEDLWPPLYGRGFSATHLRGTLKKISSIG